jgi:hypothetical protein
MATTTFSGPVVSDNGFTGDVTGNVVATATITGGLNVTGGTVIMLDLPTEDPEVVGQLWSNSGVLTVSAGA